MKIKVKLLFTALSVLILQACANTEAYTTGFRDAPQIMGPGITNNATPYSAALVCINRAIPGKLTLAVGKMPDMTGKFSVYDSGQYVPIGANHFITTALGYMSKVSVPERTDLGVWQYELKQANSKLLGDGVVNKIDGRMIPVRPIMAGSVRGSTYHFTGAITELDFSVSSGGLEAGYSSGKAGGRQFTSKAAIDLRLVDSKSTMVVASETSRKQITGDEFNAGVFGFLGNVSGLIDFNAGYKRIEPMQYSIRMLTEATVVKLIGQVIGQKTLADSCVTASEKAFLDDANKYLRGDIQTQGNLLADNLGIQDIDAFVKLPEPLVMPVDETVVSNKEEGG